MARDTLKDFLRKSPYGATRGSDRIVYEIDHQGDASADPYVDDLKSDLKTTLGDYAAEQTLGNNRHTLKPGSNQFTLKAADGRAASYDAGSTGAENSYFQEGTGEIDDADLRSYFDTISGGSSPDASGGGTFAADEISEILDKTGKTFNKSGHNVLENTSKKEFISPVLTRANRFHPDGKSPYNASKSPMTAGQVDNLPFASKQTDMGEYDENSSTVKIKEMKKIGESLLVAATGHAPSAGDNLFGGLTTAGLLPSLQQLGATKLDPNDVKTSSVMSPGFGGGNKATKGASVTRVYDSWHKKSYGVLNSPLEPFGATPKMGMTTLTIALVLAIGILVDIITAIMSALLLPLPSSQKAIEAYKNASPDLGYPGIGSESPSGLISPAFFGLRPVKGDWHDAVKLGTECYFGERKEFGTTGGLLSFIPGGKNINDSPGYYSIVFRAIIRSTIELGIQIGNAFSGGFFAILGKIADLFESIRNSKLIAYLNLLAGLGDIYEEILDDNEELTVIKVGSKDHDGVIGNKVSALDAAELKLGTQDIRVAKSRYSLKDPDPTLVWRAGAPPSSYLISSRVSSVRVEANADPTGQPGYGLDDKQYIKEGLAPSNSNSKEYATDSNRLSKAQVKEIEDAADGEYMPFYFHDLRTNEIVSFNAFLTSLTDTYAANYTSLQGYGRADPVMTYNSTTRNIGLTFWIVSTNPQDHDEMWWKINKLTSLVYPQYSGGTSVSAADINGGKSFTAPFSQIISASPMIRLRLGDLFKSNYSRFALARIFGADQMEDTTQQVPGNLADAVVASNAGATNTVSDDLKPPLLGPVGVELTTKRSVQIYQQVDGKSKLKKRRMPPGTKVKISKINPTVESLSKFLETGNFDDISAYGLAEIEVIGPSLDPKWTGKRKGLARGIQISIVERFVARRGTKGYKIPYFMLDNRGNFLPDASTVPKPPELDAPGGKLPEFLDPKTNPITRAFESSMGKGLAGFVTQMDFQWLDQTTWSVSDGSKAPKTCQVTIAFAPIHDIGPGTDNNGMNRAPIYNVGTPSRKLGGSPYEDE
ncbi:hypothetical protein OAA09_01310 [bacterium]|nr:hypothetical protein [bacterium]